MRSTRCLRMLAAACIVPMLASAQVPLQDSAAALSSQAYAAFQQGTPESLGRALRLWTDARELFRQTGDRAREADALNGIASTHNGLADARAALSAFQQELAIRLELRDVAKVGGALSGIAAQYQELGRPDSAVAAYRRSLAASREVGNRAQEGVTLLNFGGLFVDTGRPDSGIVYLRLAVAALEQAGSHAVQAMALVNLGRAHRATSRLDSALRAYSQAIAIQREVGDSANQAFTLANMGTAQSDLGRLDSALVYYYRALELDHARAQRRREAGTLNLIGLAHFRSGNSDSALVYYERGVAIASAINDFNQLGRLLNNIGELHGSANRFDSALVSFRRALPLRRQVKDRPGEALTLADMGTTHQLAGRPDSALGYFQQALAVNRDIGNRMRQAEDLGLIGSYWHRVKGAPRTGIAYYDSAAAILATIARQAGGDLNWLSFAERDVGLFEEWTLALLAMRSELGDNASGWAALAALERGRAQALLHLLRSDAVGSAAGANIAAEGRRLADIVRRSGAAALSYLVTADTLITWLALPSGAIHVARQPLASDSLSATIGELRGRLATADQRGQVLRAIALERVVEGVPATNSRRLSFEQIVRDLSEVLIPRELRDYLPSGGGLIIVPGGSLALVPFAALPLGSDGVLGDRFAIRYAPSLTTLGTVEARVDNRPISGTTPLRRALVVGDPAMPLVRNRAGAAVTLAPLPGARAESRWIATRLGTTELLGPRATETAIRARLRDASIIHLATHGFAYSANGRVRDSFIALAADSSNDGLLTVGELLDDVSETSADLVVLSACETGLGNLKQAEGTVGLQRAFLARGARSVLVSLWSVSDETTAALMKSFYTHWLGDGDHPAKSEALRRAQRDIRRVAGWEHPRFWAAFQLVGAG